MAILNPSKNLSEKVKLKQVNDFFYLNVRFVDDIIQWKKVGLLDHPIGIPGERQTLYFNGIWPTWRFDLLPVYSFNGDGLDRENTKCGQRRKQF
ncbi:hypothetical protein [Methylomicrobium sp. Wu6]|uniref:hypothetical protein n=1 Tax=Methylomicrobium sp. Wu6 TaxID=3107928 RepID=UPI002DD63865|nr:hypothetical protein [Methylomicrobium sp. Wu6]MEC4747388.1 hypothetical protein [Methylomicrobium sp. Wu6]